MALTIQRTDVARGPKAFGQILPDHHLRIVTGIYVNELRFTSRIDDLLDELWAGHPMREVGAPIQRSEYQNKPVVLVSRIGIDFLPTISGNGVDESQ